MLQCVGKTKREGDSEQIRDKSGGALLEEATPSFAGLTISRFRVSDMEALRVQEVPFSQRS